MEHLLLLIRTVVAFGLDTFCSSLLIFLHRLLPGILHFFLCSLLSVALLIGLGGMVESMGIVFGSLVQCPDRFYLFIYRIVFLCHQPAVFVCTVQSVLS